MRQRAIPLIPRLRMPKRTQSYAGEDGTNHVVSSFGATGRSNIALVSKRQLETGVCETRPVGRRKYKDTDMAHAGGRYGQRWAAFAVNPREILRHLIACISGD